MRALRYAAFTVTIPPCADAKWERYYVVSFVMSILWIMGISYFMIDWTAMIGCIIGIDQVRSHTHPRSLCAPCSAGGSDESVCWVSLAYGWTVACCATVLHSVKATAFITVLAEHGPESRAFFL